MRAAASAGAHIWNDVTALKGDPQSFDTAIALNLPLCLMHMQGEPQTMQTNPTYGDVVAEVRDGLLDQAKALEAAGLERDKICLDVGIGFGKTLAQYGAASVDGGFYRSALRPSARRFAQILY